MGLFSKKKFTALKVDVKPGKGASVARRVQRVARVKAAYERAYARGDMERMGLLEAEHDAITSNLVREQAEIAEILGGD